MNDIKNIVIGIVASLLAIIVYELYKLVFRSIDKRKLKAVLGLKNKKCLILAPIYHRDIKNSHIHYRDAYSFGHLYELVYRLKIESQLIPYHKLSEFDELSDIISVGGPLSNEYTKKLISDYKIDFATTKQTEINQFSEPISSEIITGFKIASQNFPASDNKEPCIIIKLTQNETKQNRSIIMVFGYSAQGTSSAAYYLSREYKRIYSQFGDKKFYILFYVSRRDSYKIYEDTFTDLTDKLI